MLSFYVLQKTTSTKVEHILKTGYQTAIHCTNKVNFSSLDLKYVDT